MNVYIGGPVEVSDMQGPCPSGFHVPLNTEWQGLNTIMSGLGLTTGYGWKKNLHMPFAGYRDYSSATVGSQDSYGYYWSSSPYGSDYPGSSRYLALSSSNVAANSSSYRATGVSVRCFKNSYVAPTSSWTVIQGTLGSAGIFWNQTEGLISITSDGNTGYTIMDKNLGATAVYNVGDTLSESNCGKYYQWGNNYGFPFTGSVTTSRTKVDASNYGPGNYYTSSTFITASSGTYNRDSSNNANLRGGVSQGTSTKTQEVQNIYIGEYVPIYKGEYIEYKMNADANNRLYVPIGGYGTGGSANCSYSWKVSVDGGAETTYSGTGYDGGKIILSGYTSGTNHTIKITPTTESYQWARAFGWCYVTGATNVTEIVYDSSYMGYATSATYTGAGFRWATYFGCTALTNPADEYLPDTVTNIGKDFRNNEYSYCTSLTYASKESLPDSVTTIGTYFRSGQYDGCTSLTEIKGWKDLSIGNSSYYRASQFSNDTSNKTVKVLGDVGYNSYNQYTLENAYVTSVSVPNDYLNNFKNTSNQPWASIDDSKFIGY